MSEFVIKKASRQGIIPLIGLFGKSGFGKTYSALLLARGLAGESGIIRLVDTEKGRGEIFADDIPGGYEVVRLDEPYTPDRYEKAIEAAINGASVLVVDSMSHSWEGDDGVLEKAEESREKKGPGLHNWLHKSAHSRMLRKVCSLPTPVVVCLRGKEVYRQVKDDKNKTVIVRDENTAPIQDKNFIYEMLVAFEMKKNDAGDPGYCRIEKYTSARLLPLLPKTTDRITVEHGKTIAEWCSGISQQPKKKAATPNTRQWMFQQLTAKFDDAKLTQYAIDKAIIMPDQGLLDWPLEKVPTSQAEMNQLLANVEAHQ